MHRHVYDMKRPVVAICKKRLRISIILFFFASSDFVWSLPTLLCSVPKIPWKKIEDKANRPHLLIEIRFFLLWSVCGFRVALWHFFFRYHFSQPLSMREWVLCIRDLWERQLRAIKFMAGKRKFGYFVHFFSLVFSSGTPFSSIVIRHSSFSSISCEAKWSEYRLCAFVLVDFDFCFHYFNFCVTVFVGSRWLLSFAARQNIVCSFLASLWCTH